MLFIRFYLVVLVSFGIGNELAFADNGAKVGIWKRFEIVIENSSWQGNPFDLILEATFTSPSGRNLKHFGFYAGKNSWKIYFMPDEKGKWSFKTYSEDPDLDGKSGKFSCVKSKLDAQLVADGKQWRLKDGKGDFPVIWSPPYPDGTHWGFRANSISDPKIMDALVFAEEVVEARLLAIGDLVVAPIDWAKDWPQSAVPYVEGKEGEEFYLPFWDNLNERMDAARDRNMGAYIMLYSDDALTPDNFGITPRSGKELRLFRYVIARLACYPLILWDTGIDISEYRNNEWINWFTSWFYTHDAWHHSVSSRSGGGSGGIMPDKGTYYSVGGAYLPSRSDFLKYRNETEVPIAHTDHWRPFISRGNWDIKKLRLATWRCGLTGAQALFPDFNQGVIQFDMVQQGAQQIGFASHFFKTELRFDLLNLLPHDEMLRSGDNVILAANPGNEYVVYDEDGGSFSIDLSNAHQTFTAEWYNPLNGEITPIGRIKSGTVRSFDTPTTGFDWVLHIFR
ncbi:MAG: DUF5060 domain-containing protein [Draconibacterium sp.]